MQGDVYDKTAVKVGDTITLDCGYRGPDMQPCVVVRVDMGRGLYGDKVWKVRVRMANGMEFDTTLDRV